MSRKSVSRAAVLAATFGLVFCSFQASPEDIDIFTVDDDSTVNNPNVLFVIDNSANWARQSQQWPGGEEQGQSEVDAIKTVIAELDSSVNVGLMEYITGGNSADTNSGYVRYHVRPMTEDNKTSFSTTLTTIYNNINDPSEKRSSGNPFGTLFHDVYNYLAGVEHSNNGTGTPVGLVDEAAYQPNSNFARFRSPLTTNDTCTRTIVIFIGNNVSTGPTGDSAANVTNLETLGGETDQLNFVDYVIKSTPTTVDLGYTSACYASAAACTSAENNAACIEDGFTSCSCSPVSPIDCPLNKYSVVGTRSTTTQVVVSDTTEGPTAGQYTGEVTYCQNNHPGTYACPAAVTTTSVAGNQTTQTTTSWTGCSYVISGTCGNNNNKSLWQPRGTRTVRTLVTQATTTSTQTDLGETSACMTGPSSCGPADFPPECSSYDSCACVAAGSTTGCPPSGSQRFNVQGQSTIITAEPTRTSSTPPTKGGLNFMADEWTRFLRQKGVPIVGTDISAQVTTYTIDVFNAQQDAAQSALLFNMAEGGGGGEYFQAKDKQTLIDILRQIFTEVQSVNSAFSSASLPVNATNRAQNENQVFIGVFKPDRTKDPRWFGNMKRYQLISNEGSIELGDKDGRTAINNQTGFLTDCASSFWTTDSGNYWDVMIEDDPNAEGICTTNATSDFSDLPDGPFVEKGAVAEVLRKGNNPTAVPDGSGDFTLSRNVKTLSGTTLVDFNAANTGIADALTIDYVLGQDVFDEDKDSNSTEPRSTLHGDVVHSRPQPLNFGATSPSRGVEVYYGANDGTLRGVKAETGQELWAFVAPEHLGKLSRLRVNDPDIRYFGDNTAGRSAKDYFFDGSIGVYQKADNSKVWIFPTMRRGGRKVYAFDVTAAGVPTYLWSKGCPNLVNDTGCDAGFEDIGQTWSLPNVAFIKGYPALGAETPVIVMGGGYDGCEDDNTYLPGCSGAKGRGVYVLDAETGALIRHFDFSSLPGSRSVAADVSMIDIDDDRKVDYAYAVDSGGAVFRMSFIDAPTTRNPVAAAEWDLDQIAATTGAGRKFLFTPALLQATDRVIYLAVGSGDREHPLRSQYPYDDRDGDNNADGGVLNRFYVFKDDVSVATPANLDLDDPSLMFDYSSATDCSATRVLPSSAEKGWFMDLDAQGQGEQVVTAAVIAAGFVVFSTNRPTPPVANACTNSLGEARGYFMNVLNASGAIGVSGSCGGERSSLFEGGGLPPSPVLATVPIDGEIKTVLIGAAQRSGEVSSPIEAQQVRPPIESRRTPVYWYKSTDDK